MFVLWWLHFSSPKIFLLFLLRSSFTPQKSTYSFSNLSSFFFPLLSSSLTENLDDKVHHAKRTWSNSNYFIWEGHSCTFNLNHYCPLLYPTELAVGLVRCAVVAIGGSLCCFEFLVFLFAVYLLFAFYLPWLDLLVQVSDSLQQRTDWPTGKGVPQRKLHFQV